MTFPTLRRTLLVAFGVGVLASAGQLGLGYGLGILRFGRAFDDVGVSHWAAQLAWLAWFAMTAAMTAALVAAHTAGSFTARVAGRATDPPAIGVRLAVAAAAALGGAAVAPLSMVPAQATPLPSVNPVLVTGISAALGATVGLLAAVAVLGPAPIRWNLLAVVGAGWLLALVSVAPSLGPTDPMPAVRLGVFDPAWLSVGSGQRLAIVTMPALALVAGAVTGGLARWRDHRPSVVATCGVAGAAMLSLSYLIAGPGSGADRYQTAPYWGALAAAATGLLGSVLAATVRWPLLRDTAPAQEGTDDRDVPAPTERIGTAPAESTAETTIDLGRPGVAPGQTDGSPGQADGSPGQTDGSPGQTDGSEAATGSGTVSAPAAPINRRPTTEDFWPSTPASTSTSASVPVAPAVRDPAASTIADAPAATPEPAESGHGPDSTVPGTAEPGSAEPGATQPAAEAPAAEALDPPTSEGRSDRSWRRLFRRSDPVRAQDGASAVADVENVADAGVEQGAQDRAVEPEAAAEPDRADVPAGSTGPVKAAKRGSRWRTKREPADQEPAGEERVDDQRVGDEPFRADPADRAQAGQEPVGQEPVGQEPVGQEPVGQEPVGDDRAGNNPAGNEPADRAPADPAPTDARRAAARRTRKNPADSEAPDGQAGRSEPGDGEPDSAIPQQRSRRERRGRGRSEQEVSAADAEYVDWVSGLRGRRTQRTDPSRSEGSASPASTPSPPPTSTPSPARRSAGQRQVDLPAGRDELG